MGPFVALRVSIRLFEIPVNTCGFVETDLGGSGQKRRGRSREIEAAGKNERDID